GDVGGRHWRRQLLLQLALAILPARVREIALGVVAVAVLHPQVRPLHAYGDAAEAPVLRVVAAAVAEEVVGGGVANDLRERRAEIVAVGEGLAAGVGRERLQRLLR